MSPAKGTEISGSGTRDMGSGDYRHRKPRIYDYVGEGSRLRSITGQGSGQGSFSRASIDILREIFDVKRRKHYKRKSVPRKVKPFQIIIIILIIIFVFLARVIFI